MIDIIETYRSVSGAPYFVPITDDVATCRNKLDIYVPNVAFVMYLVTVARKSVFCMFLLV